MTEIPIERKPRRATGPLVIVLLLLVLAAVGWYWWSNSAVDTPATTPVSSVPAYPSPTSTMILERA